MLHLEDLGDGESFSDVLNLDKRSPHTFPFAVMPNFFCKTELLTTHFLGKILGKPLKTNKNSGESFTKTLVQSGFLKGPNSAEKTDEQRR